MAISSSLLRCLLCAAMCMPATALFAATRSGGIDPPAPALSRVGDYPLPGRATRWDYMSLDAPGSRLFIAHLGDSAVVVVDTKHRSVVGVIPGVSAVHGVLALPELGRAYATATGRHEVVAIDLATLKPVDHIPAGSYPDGLAYAPGAHKLYVSDEEGNSETVIDVRSGKRVAAIPLGGSAGNTQYDPASRHIFVNVQSRSELAEIDPASDAIVRRIPLHGAAGNHGLLIEAQRRLAFIACEGNGKLLVLDLRTGKVAAAFDVGGDPDVLAYDEGLGVLYVATESGVLHRFRVADDGVARLGEVRVGGNAHTVAVDPVTHEVFLPLKEAGKTPVLRVMAPRR